MCEGKLVQGIINLKLVWFPELSVAIDIEGDPVHSMRFKKGIRKVITYVTHYVN